MQRLWATAALLVAGIAGWCATGPLTYWKADFSGEFRVTKTASAGSVTMDPGFYIPHFTVKNGHRFAYFTRETSKMTVFPFTSVVSYSDPLPMIPCKQEDLGAKAKETGVYYRDEGDAIVLKRLMIKGHAEACVF